MTRRIMIGVAFGLIALILLIASACEGTSTSAAQVVPRGASTPTLGEQLTVAAIDAQLRAAAQQATLDQQQTLATQAAGLATQQAALATAQAQATQQAILASVQAQATQQASLATAQAQATAQGLATLYAMIAQSTAAAQATATEAAYRQTATLAVLDRQLTATAAAWAVQLTATEAAHQRAATAEALDRAGTATEVAYQRTATADALYRAETATASAAAVQATGTQAAHQEARTVEAANQATTATALAAYAAQTATAQAIARQQQTTRYGLGALAMLLAVGLLVAAVIGLSRLLPDSFMAVWLDRRGRKPAVKAEPCPPIVVQPDGAVQIPLLHAPGQEACVVPEEQIIEVLNWARSEKERAPSAPPIGPPTAPGLRSIHSLRRLDQAAKAGVMSASLVAALEADWETGGNR